MFLLDFLFLDFPLVFLGGFRRTGGCLRGVARLGGAGG